MHELSIKITSSLKKHLPDKVSLHEPNLAGNAWEYVKDCIDAGWVSTAGKYVDEFEKKLCEETGSRYAIATVNGTSALHVALLLAGVKEGDEVLAPALTFVATPNTIAFLKAIPHFVDVEEESLGVCPDKLKAYLKDRTMIKDKQCINKETGRRIQALINVYAFGQPNRVDELKSVCDEFSIELVEDAAESLGSLYRGKHTGLTGRLAALSFNGNKILTTGGGGAILTQSEELSVRARHLTTTAKKSHPFRFLHDEVGFNYRLPNLNAALGCSQLELLDEFIEKKRNLASFYQSLFKPIKGVGFLTEREGARSNYWLNVLILDDPNLELLDEILDYLNKSGVMVRPAWTPMHKLPMYADSPKMQLNSTESLTKRIMCLPSSSQLWDQINLSKKVVARG